MRKYLAIAALALTVSLSAAAPTAAQSSTIRIEERPYYGAVVTLEAGVRVYRPLPPHSQIVINPGGRTPLNLTYEDRRSVSYVHGVGGSSYAAAEARVDGGDSGVIYRPHRPRPHRHEGGVLTARPPSGPHAGGGKH